jgi:endonuclease YncB( thermonuclease family)
MDRKPLLHLLGRIARATLFMTLLLFLDACDVTEAPVTGKVVGVPDGDTVILLIDGRKEKVRLFGIDCPELPQAFGRKAKRFTGSMVYGKTVSLVRKDTDQYGRTLGMIEVDGEFLDQVLVRCGYAWHYRRYSSSRLLDSLENEARRRKTGLWADPNPVAPWKFRNRAGHQSTPDL